MVWCTLHCTNILQVSLEGPTFRHVRNNPWYFIRKRHNPTPTEGHRGLMEASDLGGVVCGVVWCGVVWCGVVWCGVPKALLPKGKRTGCLPTGKGKRAGLCVLCARCA